MDHEMLLGEVDEPRPGQLLDGRPFTVRGWFAWDGRPALAVAVLLDGELVGHATVGSEARPDVAEALGNPSLTLAGWTTTIDPSALVGEGDVDLTLVVWGHPSSPPSEVGPLQVHLGAAPSDREETEPDGPGFIGHFDLPPVDEHVGPDVVRLAGWIHHRSGPLAELDVFVDGEPVGPARLGVYRSDVAAIHGLDAGVGGFEALVSLSGGSKAGGEVLLEVRARALGATAQPAFARTVPVAGPPPVDDRAARDEELARRRRRLVAAWQGATTDDLDLVVITHDLSYGGAQLWLDELLRRSGAGSAFRCAVVALGDGPLRDALEGRGIPVHVTQPTRVADADAYEGRITELAALVAAGGHNAVLVNTLLAQEGADVGTRLGVPTVWAIHESLTPPEYWLQAYGGAMAPGVRCALGRAFAACDGLVFVADATRRLYEGWAGPGRTVTIPYGVDTGAIEDYCRRVSRADARSLTGLPPDARVVLVIGTMEPRKNQIRVAQAMEQLGDLDGSSIVAFVGDTGTWYGEGLRHYLGHAGLEDRALVVPMTPDPSPWYRAADVLLSASDVESMPRSALEAMCFGLPVVAASVFGVPELLTDGETGFLFAPGNLDALIEALRLALSGDADRLGEVAAAGQTLARERYDSAGYASAIRRLLEGLRRDRRLTPAEVLAGP